MRIVTVGEIARRAGVPVHRVTYVIDSRRIPALGRAGQARVFSDEAAERILAELGQIAERHRQSTGAVV